MSTSQPPTPPPVSPTLEEQMTFTYARGDAAERICLARGLHDPFLQGKSQLDDSKPEDTPTRAHVRATRSGDDFVLYAVHSWNQGQPLGNQAPSWEAYLFTTLQPMTREQRALARIMLDAIAGLITARLRGKGSHIASGDFDVPTDPRRLG